MEGEEGGEGGIGGGGGELTIICTVYVLAIFSDAFFVVVVFCLFLVLFFRLFFLFFSSFFFLLFSPSFSEVDNSMAWSRWLQKSD